MRALALAARRGAPGCILLLAGAAGCAVYRSAPIDDHSLAEALAPMPVPALRAAVAELDHPWLRPLSFDPADGVSPEEAAVWAVVTNPELRAERARRGEAEAALLAAGLLPNPQVDAAVDLPIQPQPGVQVGRSLGLSIQILPPGLRAAEVRSARDDLASFDLELAWKEWQVAQEARLAVYQALILDRAVARTAEQEAVLERTVAALSAAVSEGLASEVDRAAATGALLDAQAARLDLEQQLAAARRQLRRDLGLPPGTELSLQATAVPELPPVPRGGELVQLLDHRRLDLIALRLGYQSQEEAVRAAILRQFPSLSVGLTHAVDTGGVATLSPGISLTVPLFDRNQGGIAAARATRTRLRADYGARVFAAQADVAEILAESAQVRERIAAERQRLDELRQVAETYRRALDERLIAAPVYYTARAQALASEVALDQLDLRRAELRVGLETATGPLDTAQPPTEVVR